MTPRVSLIYKRYPHHSAWSGYPLFTEHLGGLVDARRVAPTLRPKWLLDLSVAPLDYKPLDRERIGLDLSAAKRLVLGRGEVVHLLYGEADHFHAGRPRGIGHLRGNRLVATFHPPPAALDREKVRAPVLGCIDFAITLGSRATAHMRGLLGTKSVFQAFLGVDTRSWIPAPTRRAPTPTCVFVGSHLRDFPVFEEVVRLVATESPSVRFDVVSSANHCAAVRRLASVRTHTDLPDPTLRSIYHRAWVHVLPLTDAVGCNALLEGMATGLPTVTTAVGDVPDYTRSDGAICVAPGDPIAMAEAALRLLDDRRLRDELGEAARRTAEQFDVRISAQRHAEIYNCVIDAGRGRPLPRRTRQSL